MYGDRTEAGRLLADELLRYKEERPVILALPRGGVPVALAIANRLDAPLDLLLVRKIGVAWQPELAAGAVIDGADPIVVINDDIVAMAGITPDYIEREIKVQLKEIERRRALYLRGRPPVAVEGRTAIVVDDGIATGATMRAGLQGVKRRHPAKLVLAVPVAAASTLAALRAEVDEVVCPLVPEDMGAIGYFYEDFRQVSDEEVVEMLRHAPTPESVRQAPP